jgi:hypothetical protein
VSENRVLSIIFAPKRDDVTGEWRKLHNKELNDLYSSPNIIRVIKWRMRCLGHLKHIWGREEAHTGFWWGNLRERDHLEDQGVDRRIILRWIFRKWDGGPWTGLIWFRMGRAGGGTCECGNESSYSVK